MCGLFFVLQRNKPIDKSRFQQALNTSKHRGPDHQGVKFQSFTLPQSEGGPQFHAAFGHNRLSILDVDPRAHQPFESNDATLLYNGEIYNFADLKEQITQSHSTTFHTTSDTEVVMAGINQHGPSWLEQCNGMWALCHVNIQSGIITAARDRYGKKPLFFYMDDSAICLSSNIKAIVDYLNLKPRIRPNALKSFLVHGSMFPQSGPDTHLDVIDQIAPNSTVTIDLKEWASQSSKLKSERTKVDAPDLSELPDLIESAARLRLVSDRRVGMLLSGGVDSTIVLSALHKMGLHEGVTCFIGDTGRSQDADYAMQCATALGIEPVVVKLDYGESGFRRFEEMCIHHEKPFPLNGNAMAMPSMYEAVASHGVPVALDGTGGDEIFGGYWDRYYPIAMREALATGDFKWAASGFYQNAAILRTLAKKKFKQSMRSSLAGQKSSFANPINKYAKFDVAHSPSTDPLSGWRDSLSDAQYSDAFGGRLGDWIWQNDRNAMMYGVENRSPLLDYRLTKFVDLPNDEKFNGRWNKYALRKSFSQLTPLPTQWRVQKQGFRWAQRRFYNENKDNILELMRSSGSLAEYFDLPGYIDDLNKNQRMMRSNLLPRLLTIAGVGNALDLSA